MSRLLVSDNTFTGLGSGAVQFLNSPFEGLCARHAVVTRNSAVDVNQLYTSGDAPNGAFWTASLPPRASSVGTACHQDLLFESNSVDSGPHSAYSIRGAERVGIAHADVTTCDDDHAAKGYPPVFVGPDVLKSAVRVSGLNSSYSTVPRVCAKRASLVKDQRTGRVYFLNIMYGNQVSQILHPISGCNHCGDADLCTTLGVHQVSSSFISSRAVGSPFNCKLLPGPRFLKCSACAGKNAIYFQATPADTRIHHVSTCTECPGNLCSRVVDVPQQYFKNLAITEKFQCTMLSAIVSTHV